MKSIAAVIIILAVSLPWKGTADIIYFKDGMRTVCQGRVWEEGDEVKCDYDGVVLTYRLEDVEHIHQTILPQETGEAPEAETTTALPDPALSPASEQSASLVTDGPSFYDPRRPHKYWSSASARHNTYQEAIDALAREFGRPARWVEERIGETNSLERIRARMSQPDEEEKISSAPSPADRSVSGILFYSPRREYKYQIGAAAKFQTFDEAIAALAMEYEATPQWVEEHMGQHNDVGAIREQLRRAKGENSGGQK